MANLKSCIVGTAIAVSCSGVACFPEKSYSKHYVGHLTPASFKSASFEANFAASCNNLPIRRRSVTTSFSKAPPKEEGSFFESSIVQMELTRIHSDYKKLFLLGRNYPLFDREGKLSYIREMQDVLERWQIFHKRMELSDDLTVKLYAKHLKAEVSPYEESNFEMVLSFHKALDEMKREVEAGI